MNGMSHTSRAWRAPGEARFARDLERDRAEHTIKIERRRPIHARPRKSPQSLEVPVDSAHITPADGAGEDRGHRSASGRTDGAGHEGQQAAHSLALGPA